MYWSNIPTEKKKVLHQVSKGSTETKYLVYQINESQISERILFPYTSGIFFFIDYMFTSKGNNFIIVSQSGNDE